MQQSTKKVIFTQVVKKLPAFSWNQMFTTQFTSLHPKSHFNNIFYLRIGPINLLLILILSFIYT